MMYVVFVWCCLFSVIFVSFVKCDSNCDGTSEQELVPFQPLVITSPNFENGSYPENTTCTWVIDKPQNVTAEFQTLVQIEIFNFGCPEDFLRVYSGRSASGPSIFDEFECMKGMNRSRTTIVPGPVYIEFQSAETSTEMYTGFRITLLAAKDSSEGGCATETNLFAEVDEKFITSQQFPGKYPLNSDCSWNLTSTTYSMIEVVVYFLDIDTDPACSFHRLDVTVDGNTTTLCSRQDWEMKTFNGMDIRISFQSDAANRRGGFLLGYRTMDPYTTTEYTTVVSTTGGPDYYDQYGGFDYNYNYNDYSYFGWNEPVATTTAAPTHHHHDHHSGFWDFNWNPFLYLWLT